MAGAVRGCRQRHWLAVAHDGDVVDDDGSEGLVVAVALDTGDGGDEQDGVRVALAEDGVFAVELRGRDLR